MSTAFAIAGAVVKGISGWQAANYRKKVALNNAKIYEDNANRVLHEASVDAKDTDIRASGEIGALLARQASSGLDMTSGSALRARVSAYKLAARDRKYIMTAGTAAATRQLQGAADERATASQAQRAGIFSLVGGAIGVGSAIVSGQAQAASTARTSLVGG